MKQIFKDTLTIVIASAVIIGGYAIYDNLPSQYHLASFKEYIVQRRNESNKYSRMIKRLKPDRRLPAEITTLPNIPGYGELPSLRIAMADDESGVLKDLVKKTKTEKNPKKRKQLINNIIFHWVGVADVDPQSRKPEGFKHNPLGDARILLVLEKFLGEKYHNIYREGEEANKPRGKNEIFYLHKAYNDLYIFVESALNTQTILYPYFADVLFTDKSSGQEAQVIEKIRSIADKEYKIYLLETLELSEKTNKLFDDAKFRSLAKQDSKDEFEIYLKDFGKHSHEYRFQVTDDKPIKKQKK